MHNGEYAGDVALLAITHAAAMEAIKTYVTVAGLFGLTASRQKTKFMVTGHGVTEEDRIPIALDGGQIEYVNLVSSPT